MTKNTFHAQLRLDHTLYGKVKRYLFILDDRTDNFENLCLEVFDNITKLRFFFFFFDFLLYCSTFFRLHNSSRQMPYKWSFAKILIIFKEV